MGGGVGVEVCFLGVSLKPLTNPLNNNLSFFNTLYVNPSTISSIFNSFTFRAKCFYSILTLSSPYCIYPHDFNYTIWKAWKINITHFDVQHLVINLLALLSGVAIPLEKIIGNKKFGIIIIGLMVLQVVTLQGYTNFTGDTLCTVGFSGVLAALEMLYLARYGMTDRVMQSLLVRIGIELAVAGYLRQFGVGVGVEGHVAGFVNGWFVGTFVL